MSSKHIKPEYISNEEMNRLVTSRIKELEAMVVCSFDGDYPPSFTQGLPTNELQDIVTAKQCTFMVNKIQDLTYCVDSLLSIVENSNCCDSPLYRDDIEAIKARFNGSK